MRARFLISVCVGVLLLSLNSIGQRSDWKTNIDYLVDEIDSLSLKSQTTFYATKYITAEEPYKETWHFTMRDGKVIFIEIRYVIEHREFTETYYLDKNRMICMEVYEMPFLAYYVDQIKRGQMAFFVNNSLKLNVVFGNDRSHSPYSTYTFADSESECLQKFQDRFSELQKTLPIIKNMN
jgi:hypothetical protein